MNYEFAALEHMVEVTINPDVLSTQKAVNHQRNVVAWRTQFVNERIRICNEVHKSYYAAQTPELAGRYIKDQLRGLATLSDRLRHFMKVPPGAYPVGFDQLYVECTHEAGIIANYFLRHFEEHFDYDMAVPYGPALNIRITLQALLNALTDKFDQDGDMLSLFEVVFDSLYIFLRDPANTISYRHHLYYELLLNTLLQLKPGSPDANSFAVHSILNHLNFNLQSYIDFAVTNLLAKISNISADQKLEKLRWYIKAMKQVEMTPGLNIKISYTAPIMERLHARGVLVPRPDAEAVTRQITSWINEEMQYIEYIDQLEKGMILPEKNGQASMEKIATSLSVAKLAVFVEVFIASGIFISDNMRSYAATLRAVARIVYTPGTEKLSYESLRAKAYALRKSPGSGNGNGKNRNTIEACKDMFLDCYNICQKMLK